MTSQTALIGVIVLVAISFDFLNGFHDAANSIATVVSTRVLSPAKAVLWAAFFNFVAAFVIGTHVANTVGKGMVDPSGITVYVILAALIGAIFWDLITWYYGLPSSSSHALIGGFGGAAVVHAGWKVLILAGFRKTILFIVISPVVGFFLGYLLMVLMANIFHRQSPSFINGIFRKGQFLSSALCSLSHGANDSQKTMGIIVALLVAGNQPAWAYRGDSKDIAWWIILCCYAAMGLGTMTGGWRIVKTMGQRITKLRPVDGFCVETGGAFSIFMATYMGIPVSTTHTITGSIMGVGSITSFSSVRWGVAGRIVWAWILTIPASALVAGLCEWAFTLLGWQ